MNTVIDMRSAAIGALLLRLTMGSLFLIHAGLKFFVFTPAGTEKYFASLGLPGWFGLLIMAAEVVAGLALIIGIWPRLVALLMVPDLIGAIVLVHIHNGFFFNAPGGGWEYPAFWALALVALALIGEGAYAAIPTAFGNRVQS